MGMKAPRGWAADDWAFDVQTITVRIPMQWKRRGGRKVIIAPEGGDAWAPAKPRPDEILIRALARAHRWKRMLEEGRYRSSAEIAEAEGTTRSFVNRLLRLITGQMRPERIDCTHFGSMTVLNGADLGQKLPLPFEIAPELNADRTREYHSRSRRAAIWDISVKMIYQYVAARLEAGALR